MTAKNSLRTDRGIFENRGANRLNSKSVLIMAAKQGAAGKRRVTVLERMNRHYVPILWSGGGANDEMCPIRVAFGHAIPRPSSFMGSSESKLNGSHGGNRSAGSRDSACRTPAFGPRSFPFLLRIPT